MPRTREAQARLQEAKAQKTSDWSWEVDYGHRSREFGDMVNLQFTFDLPIFAGRRQNPGIAAKQAELDQLDAEREAATREQRAVGSAHLRAWLARPLPAWEAPHRPLGHGHRPIARARCLATGDSVDRSA